VMPRVEPRRTFLALEDPSIAATPYRKLCALRERHNRE